MRQRVSVSTASAFLALVIRKTLARSSHVEAPTEHRSADAALAALRESPGLCIVDVELLLDGPDGGALRKELCARRTPSIVVDARGRGVDPDVLASPVIVVVSGHMAGELDAGMIEAELLAAVGSALRMRGSRTTEPLSPLSSLSPEPALFHQSALELIVIGVSTGGPTLLLRLFEEVREPAIPMLIVQHMPGSETAGFAARLTEHTGLTVREVTAGPLPPAGVIGVLAGGCDFRLVRRGATLHLRNATLEGNPFHPNVDEVLTSAVAADVAVGAVILTGMGQDGAAGALAMARKGLPVIAQRPDTCAVAGMPQAVIDNGAARWTRSPEGIASTLNAWNEAARRGARLGEKNCLG
ncbi:MAG TPA: CheB methylesterase domain-containing protein [Polyangia bacterium]|jgi:two-component system chemotaxis response regulator CheB|nr:CheB methylesterase domain-containing protein [Polyangia bacterium]